MEISVLVVAMTTPKQTYVKIHQLVHLTSGVLYVSWTSVRLITREIGLRFPLRALSPLSRENVLRGRPVVTLGMTENGEKLCLCWVPPFLPEAFPRLTARHKLLSNFLSLWDFSLLEVLVGGLGRFLDGDTIVWWLRPKRLLDSGFRTISHTSRDPPVLPHTSPGLLHHWRPIQGGRH